MNNRAQRKWRNQLIEPFVQIKFGMYVVTLALVYSVLLGILLWTSYQEQYYQFMAFYQGTDGDLLFQEKMFNRYVFGLSGALLLFIVTIFAAVIMRTHKMYGPMVTIRRFVDDLLQGKFSSRVKIREGDDFQDLVDSLNSVASALEKRHGDKPFGDADKATGEV